VIPQFSWFSTLIFRFNCSTQCSLQAAILPAHKKKELGQHWARNKKVSQIEIQVPLKVPDGCSAAAYYADMEQTFLETHRQDQVCRMSVQGVEIATWWFQGSMRMREDISQSLFLSPSLHLKHENERGYLSVSVSVSVSPSPSPSPA
jgi:hypothetical protein